MTKIKRIFTKALLLLTAAAIVAGAFVFYGSADEPDAGKLATFASPAICAEAGREIDLSTCSVQFEYGGDAVPGTEIAWTDGNGTVGRFTPPSAGIYPLTAAYRGVAKKVWVVAAAQGSSDYVIYENDFSTDPSGALSVIQQTSGATVTHDASAGTLVLDGTPPSDGYIRVLFSDIPAEFGDVIIETSLKLTQYKSATSRWGSVMLRVSSAGEPYLQTALRYNSSASNGCEIAERTSASAWNVMSKGSCSASNTAFNTVTVKASGKSVEYRLNGAKVLSQDNAPHVSGGIGFQVRGVRMEIDSIKVKVNPDSAANSGIIPGHYASPDFPDSPIALSPALVKEISTADDFAGLSLASDMPEVAVFTAVYDASSSRVDVVLASGSAIQKTSFAACFEALGGKAVPCFRVSSDEAANAVALWLRESDIRDAMIISDSASRIVLARKINADLHAALDFSSFSGDSAETIRSEAVKAGARIVILPGGMMNKESVSYLQDRYVTCWADVGGNATASVRAINSGISGLICDSPAETLELMNSLYPENTLTRYSNVIGHRGLPSLYQENSITGSVKAYEAGACMVENDIHLSADGVLIVMHDATIDRTTNGTGNISSMTLPQISAFKIVSNTSAPEEPIPTLEDYFKQFSEGQTIVIELKDNNSSAAAPLAKLIKDYDMLTHVVVISFHEAAIKAIREKIPEISAAWLNSSITPDDSDYMSTLATVMPYLQRTGAVYSPSFASGALGENLIRQLMIRGVSTWTWTLNKQEQFDRYFAMGVRGLTTNYSQWASKYCKELRVERDEEAGTWKITGVSYNGTEVDLTGNSKVTCVSADGRKVEYDRKTGKISSDPGDADVFFTFTSRTTSGENYSLVTSLFRVSFPDSAATGEESAATTEPGTGTGDAPDTTAEPEVTEPSSGKKGCGSAAGSVLIAAVFVAAAAVRGKKRD